MVTGCLTDPTQGLIPNSQGSCCTSTASLLLRRPPDPPASPPSIYPVVVVVVGIAQRLDPCAGGRWLRDDGWRDGHKGCLKNPDPDAAPWERRWSCSLSGAHWEWGGGSSISSSLATHTLRGLRDPGGRVLARGPRYLYSCGFTLFAFVLGGPELPQNIWHGGQGVWAALPCAAGLDGERGKSLAWPLVDKVAEKGVLSQFSQLDVHFREVGGQMTILELHAPTRPLWCVNQLREEKLS